MTYRNLFLLASAFLFTGAPAAAQSVVTPGQRVRVVFQEGGFSRRTAATVLEVRGDSLTLQWNDADTRFQRTLLVTELQSLEVSRGKGRPVRWGTVGAVGGATAGLALSVLDKEWWNKFEEGPAFEGCTPPCNVYRPVPYPEWRRWTLVTGGLAVGAILGAVIPGDEWTRVRLDVAPSTAGNGATAVGVTLRL